MKLPSSVVIIPDRFYSEFLVFLLFRNDKSRL